MFKPKLESETDTVPVRQPGCKSQGNVTDDTVLIDFFGSSLTVRGPPTQLRRLTQDEGSERNPESIYVNLYSILDTRPGRRNYGAPNIVR